MLTIPTKGRYSIRILARIAAFQDNQKNEKNRVLRKKDISIEENISEDYAEQILMRLKTAGFIESYRGPSGGFLLAKPANTISILEVLEAMDGNINLAPCTTDSCKQQTTCGAKKVWLETQQAIINILKNTTIADIASEIKKINSELYDYAI